jgi:hypothetical protein
MNVRGKDKYRYYISTDGETTWLEVVLTKPVTLSGSREGKLRDFRQKSSEWKFVKYENVPIYNLIAALTSFSTVLNKIQVKIDLYENYITLTQTVFEGYIPLESIKMNVDYGTITFTPEEDSKYTWWDEHKGDKKNLLDIAGGLINIIETSVPIEYYLPLSLECDSFRNLHVLNHSDITIEGGDEVLNNDASIPIWTLGVTYYQDWDGPIWRLAGWVVDVQTVMGKDFYTFCYCIKDHIADALNCPHGVNGATYWVSYTNAPYDNAVYHVIQQRSNFRLPGYVRGNGTFDPTFTGESGDNDDATNCPAEKFCRGWYETVTDGTAMVNDGGAIGLFATMNHFLTGSGLTFHSDFFSLATNPVTGTTNKLTNLYFLSNAFTKACNIAKTISDFDDTTLVNEKLEVEFEELVNSLCDTWNLAWYISGTYFIIEHIKFFENGNQYVGTPGIYAELTNKTNYPIKYQTIEDISGQNEDGKIGYTGSHQKEIFKFSDTKDFGSIILYYSALAKKGSSITYAPLYSTDITYIVDYPDDASSDGICLVACDSSDNILRRNVTQGQFEHTLNSWETAEVFTLYANGDIFYDNLIRDFWIYSRYFLSGKINSDAAYTTFQTQKRTKKQEQLRIPRITGVFEPLKLITTNLGNGEVESYVHDLDVDFINVLLLYTAG